MEMRPETSLLASNLDLPLYLSHCMWDIQRRNVPFCSDQSTVAEAIDWLGVFGARTVPMLTGDCLDRQTIAFVQAVDANAILQVLLEHLADHTHTLTDFFAIPLSQCASYRASIVYPELDWVAAAGRMYHEQKDLLLVAEGIRLSGVVTCGDLFDAMIGAAVLDNALFTTDSNDAAVDAIIETTRFFCLQHAVSSVIDTTPLYRLSTDNTILTTLRVQLNQPTGYVLLTNRQTQCSQLITAPMMLLSLLKKFKQAALGSARDSLAAVLMQPVEVLLDHPRSLSLTSESSVLEAMQTVRFNDLSCAAVISEQQRLEGVVTSRGLLKAFLDSMCRPFQA